jgi:tetratricopeptide (TPR) repeat protein
VKRLFILSAPVILLLLLIGCSHLKVRTDDDMIRYGIELSRKGYWRDAAIHWRMVLDKDPNNAAAINNLAVAAEYEGLTENARQGYAKALSLRPSSVFIQKNLEALNERQNSEITRVSDKEYNKYDKKKKDEEFLPEQ